MQFKEPLSKKYRPQNFSDIIYHEEVKTILINSILEKSISNGILLYGEKGTGKTTIARIFAKSLNCENPKNGYEPCNICDSCFEISNSRHPDVMEIDAASKNSVDSIRELIEEAKYLPTKSEYKIYILDEVHMLSNSAFNALLKILEEPPYYVKFCLSTTEYHKIPATIISRCQRLNLKKIDNEILKKQLQIISEKENIKIDEKSLNIISSVAKGSARDAISILDQASILTNQNIVSQKLSSIIGYQDDENELIDLINEICELNTENSLKIINDIYQKNISIDLLFSKILDLLTELMIYQRIGLLNEKQNLYIYNIDLDKIKKITDNHNFKKLNNIWNIFIESQNILKDNIYDNQLYLLNLTILKASTEDEYYKNSHFKTFNLQSDSKKENNITLKNQEQLDYTVEKNIETKNIEKNFKVQEIPQKEIENNISINDQISINNQINEEKSINQKNENYAKEKEELNNHFQFLKILKQMKENELENVAKNHSEIFNYQKFEIYDNHIIPTKYLQMFFKILKQYSDQKWKIIYIDDNNKDKIRLKENKNIQNITSEKEIVIENNTSKEETINDIKDQFLKTDFFQNAKERFDINSENVKITK
jgi:DNA polymerase-3 subunit gamma/tau